MCHYFEIEKGLNNENDDVFPKSFQPNSQTIKQDAIILHDFEPQ